MVPDEVRSRYAMVIDGDVMDSKRLKYLTKDKVLAEEYTTQIMGLNNWIDSYKGQIDGLKHDLAMTQYQLDQLRYGGRATTGKQLPADELHGMPGRALVAELGWRVRRRIASLFGVTLR